jgi:predicted secreted protein
MLLATALKGISKHREALLELGSASSPSQISEHTHRLTLYLDAAGESLADLEAELEIKETASFHEHVKKGKSVNASKESVRREFTQERATIIRTSRLITSGFRLVSECQSRVKHLIAEANNQI